MTAAALVVQTGLAAVVGIVLAREFGRGPETDGFFAAYGVYVVLVLVLGAVITYLVVPQPTGSGTIVRRSRWSAALGFFAAVPIAYLVMVVAVQVVRPWLG